MYLSDSLFLLGRKKNKYPVKKHIRPLLCTLKVIKRKTTRE